MTFATQHQEMVDHLRVGPIPHRMIPGGVNADGTAKPERLQVMDLSQIPGAMRSFFDANGMFIGYYTTEAVPARTLFKNGVFVGADDPKTVIARPFDAAENRKAERRIAGSKLPDGKANQRLATADRRQVVRAPSPVRGPLANTTERSLNPTENSSFVTTVDEPQKPGATHN